MARATLYYVRPCGPGMPLAPDLADRCAGVDGDRRRAPWTEPRPRWLPSSARDYDALIDRDVEHKEEQDAREEESRSEEAGKEGRSKEASKEGGEEEEVDPR
jgi:hypothetical protein